MQKIEGAVAGIGNIHNITSLAIEGRRSIFIEFQIGTPIDRAVADVRDAVAKVRVEPAAGHPGTHRAARGRGRRPDRLLRGAARPTRPRSSCPGSSTTPSPSACWAVPGVAQVSRGGGVNREIRVELDPGAHAGARASPPSQVNQQLRTLNLDSPGGRAQVGGGEQSIRVLGGARTALGAR